MKEKIEEEDEDSEDNSHIEDLEKRKITLKLY